ncbi:MAG: glycerophosphodiester phosphodiesterase [Cyclobacteriaceae bacterium]
MSCGKSESQKEENESQEVVEVKPNINLDIQGHRGARGLLPENTVIGFKRALDLGVNTLELDVVITKDNRVLVSHDPYMSAEICMHDETGIIDEADQMEHNIYEMTYAETQQYNCGSKMHPRFKFQGKVNATKPLLSTVFSTIERYASQNNIGAFNYNIEIKSSEELEGEFFPSPEALAQLVYDEIEGIIDWNRVRIQSFDFRVLQIFNKTYPNVELGALVEDEGSWQSFLDKLGFTPQVYSCDFPLLTEEMVKALQAKGIKVIPWTINEPEDMTRIVNWGVDGIITDYPDKAIALFKP